MGRNEANLQMVTLPCRENQAGLVPAPRNCESENGRQTAKNRERVMMTFRSHGAASMKAGAAGIAIIASLLTAPGVSGQSAAERPTATAADHNNATPPTTRDDDTSAQDIVVTGSRITTSGFTAPTPTTVVDASAITANAQPNVFNAIAQLPSL